MDKESQIALIIKSAKEWNKWRDKFPDIKPNLAKANLPNLNLHGINLKNADLFQTDFNGSNLSDAHLFDADFTEANLSNTNFSNAWLCRSNLTKAKFHGTNFSAANLDSAKLYYVEFKNVKFTDAIFDNAKFYKAIFSGNDLSRVRFRRADLPYSDFSGLNLWRTDFTGSNLSRANFSDSFIAEPNDGEKYSVVFDDYKFKIRFNGADLSSAIFNKANLHGATFIKAKCKNASFLNGSFSNADFSFADLHEANLSCGNFSKASFASAVLFKTDLRNANLTNTDFSGANMNLSNLSNADFKCADLTESKMVQADIGGAVFSECRVYGCSTWGLKGIPKEQSNIIVTQYKESTITVDDLQVAQFIYLLLNRENLRNILDSITSKSVLLLGRFTPERKKILEAMANQLRKYNLLPIIFDFERPSSKDFTETIKTLAGLSLFVIADITNPKSSPLELQATVPDYQIPFVPIIQENEPPFSMLSDLIGKYDWMLDPVLTYSSIDDLVAGFKEAIVDRAWAKHQELQLKKTMTIKTQSINDFIKHKSF